LRFGVCQNGRGCGGRGSNAVIARIQVLKVVEREPVGWRVGAGAGGCAGRGRAVIDADRYLLRRQYPQIAEVVHIGLKDFNLNEDFRLGLIDVEKAKPEVLIQVEVLQTNMD